MKKLLVLFLILGNISAFASDDSHSTELKSSSNEVAALREFVHNFRKNKELRHLLKRSMRSKNELERNRLKELISSFFNDRGVQFDYDAGTYISSSLLFVNDWSGGKSVQQYRNNWFNRNRAESENISFGPGFGASAGYMVSVCVSGNDSSDHYGVRSTLVLGVGMAAELTAGGGRVCALISVAVGLEAHLGFTGYDN